LRVRRDDGTEEELKAGDVSLRSTGHDTWVVGNEPAGVVDFQGVVGIGYAQEAAKRMAK